MIRPRGMDLLGEDAQRLFLDKPAGLPVFPPHADAGGDCVLRRLLEGFPERDGGWPPGFEGGIAHRLDTATSGVLVVARAPEHLAGIRAQFAAGELRKRYCFHSSAPAPFDATLCEIPLAHHPNRADRMVVQWAARTAHRGRWYPAWTRLRRLEDGWWDCEIRTGVMHQIRAHAAFLRIPLTGDVVYGGAPGVLRLHALQVIGRGWASPCAPLRD